MQVQPVEFWATIYEVSDSGGRTRNFYVIGIGTIYDCVISGRQPSEVLGGDWTRNDGEANIIQFDGGQSATFKDFVDQGLLPASRAGHCAAEYRQAADAFLATIQPHVNMTMMNQVLTTATWITPEDLK